MAPQAGSGGFKAFLGNICPKPRGLSATSPAPEVFLGAPQRAIFAFRSRKGASSDFFFGAKGASSIFFWWAEGASSFFIKRGFGLFFEAKKC